MGIGENFIITLEVQDDGSIKLQNFRKSVDDAGTASDGMGEKTKVAGDTGTKSFHTLGLAAGRLAENFGIPFRAAHMLGTEVKDMAQNSFPMWGAALASGTIALALGAAGIIKYVEHKKKMEEQTVASAEALTKELLGMEQYKEKTLAQIQATQALNEAERKLAINELEKAIRIKTKAMEEQLKAAKDLAATLPAMMLGEAWTGEAEQMKGFDEFTGKVMENTVLKTNKIRAEIKKMIADKEAFKAITQTSEDYTKQQGYYAADQEWAKENSARKLAIQKDDIQARLGLSKTQYEYDKVSNESKFNDLNRTKDWEKNILNQELNDINFQYAQKIAAADKAGASTDQINKLYDQRAIEGSKKRLESMTRIKLEELRLEEQTQKNKILMMQGAQMVLGGLYELSGQKMKAFYYLQQIAAAGEAYIQYQLAAGKAVGQAGWFGIGMAAYFEAMSYAVPALIMAKAFTSGAGGESSAMPTYSANPSTGLPAAAATPVAPNLTLIINGKNVDIGDIAKNALQYIYNNNNSVNGFTVAVERSA